MDNFGVGQFIADPASLATAVTPGDALAEAPAGTFNVQVDGVTIQVNGSNELEVISALVPPSSWKTPACFVATTGNITLSGPQTVDGESVTNQDVLAWQQTDLTENGIYTAAAGAWTRRSDFDADADVIAGAVVIVQSGATHADRGFLCTNEAPVVVGTDPITFLNAFSTAVAGTVTSVGLALPGSTFSVSGSPVTGAGTLTGTFINQPANTVLAGPTSGLDAAPTWRALVAADIPAAYSTDIVEDAVAAARGDLTRLLLWDDFFYSGDIASDNLSDRGPWSFQSASVNVTKERFDDGLTWSRGHVKLLNVATNSACVMQTGPHYHLQDGVLILETAVSFEDDPDVTNAWLWQFGIFSGNELTTIAGSRTNGAYFRIDRAIATDTLIYAENRNASTGSPVSTGVSCPSGGKNVPIKFKIEVDQPGGEVRYYVNDALTNTINTNVPSATNNYRVFMGENKTAGAVARPTYADWVKVSQTLSAPRY